MNHINQSKGEEKRMSKPSKRDWERAIEELKNEFKTWWFGNAPSYFDMGTNNTTQESRWLEGDMLKFFDKHLPTLISHIREEAVDGIRAKLKEEIEKNNLYERTAVSDQHGCYVSFGKVLNDLLSALKPKEEL